MVDQKVTQLTEATNFDSSNDLVVMVDVSDTTMNATGMNKKINRTNFLGAVLANTEVSYTTALNTKLSGIETGATADQTGAEIKALYEAESNTNAFTDALLSKLNAIEAGATADQSDAEIKTAYENNANTNAFTDAEKTKLSGIATGAEVNQNAFTTIAVAGQSDIVADSKTDTLTFVGGGNVTITTNATNDTITISSSGGGGGGGGGGSGDAWSDPVDANIVPDADSTRNLGSSASRFANAYIDDLEITNDIVVSGTVDGRDIASDGTKLDGIESGATGDQTGAEIKSLYEAEADTNAFTDALLTKLTNIETNATADQTGAEIKALYEAESNTNAFTDTEKTKLGNLTLPNDTAFGSSWNGVTADAPTKNAVYDALSSRSLGFGFLVSGEDGTAKIKMPYAGTINSLDDLYCSSGSIDIEIRIASNVNDAGTVVTSLTGLTASSTPTDTTATGANTFTAGQYIFIITSSDSSSEGLNGTLNITRTG